MTGTGFPRISGRAVFWLCALVLSIPLAMYSKPLTTALGVEWMVKYPAAWIVPLKVYVSDLMRWLIDDATFGIFTLREMLRFFSSLMEVPMNLAIDILATGAVKGSGSRAVELLPPLSWISVTVIFMALGHYVRGWRLATFLGASFLYLAVFGLWQSAMMTLASITVAVPFGVVAGLLLGIASYKWRWVEIALRPVLDLMQTVPVFAYLVPILFMFGFGPVSAMIATIIYAMPPMIRMTNFALHNVPEEIKDFGAMVGCTQSQVMRKVLVPSAQPGLMVGVNQVIMLSLNMVIIASMIGAGGLGYDVLFALRRLDIGGGIEAGIAIVVLAIALDRLSQALATRRLEAHDQERRPFLQRHPRKVFCLAVILVGYLGGLVFEGFQDFPEAWQLSTQSYWGELVRYINVTFYDQLEAVKLFFLFNILLPVKMFMLGLPWPWVIGLVAIGGWQLGGFRLAALSTLLLLFILVTGQWVFAMISLYLSGISVVIATVLGIPLGILASENKRAGQVIGAVIDTLQTLPAFVYLIPVVMFFKSGDFSALIAVILYALAPAIRYTAHGLDQVHPSLVEAGKTSGCTRWQLLGKIKLPLAYPEMMVGFSQTIMLALSMLVITALVGTRDLGQQVYTALSRADPGLGLVAGLSVAFIAIVADRFVSHAAKRASARIGT